MSGKPKFVRVAKQLGLGYRRNKSGGVWVMRVADGKRGNSIRTIGAADDFDDADGVDVLTFWQAQDKVRLLARENRATAIEPVTVEQALASYEGAVLGALEDTEGALISYGRAQSRRDALQVAAAASDRASDLARRRFEGGLIDFLEVLDAERTALSAELLWSQSRTDAATSLIAVYKALGAGWRAPGAK